MRARDAAVSAAAAEAAEAAEDDDGGEGSERGAWGEGKKKRKRSPIQSHSMALFFFFPCLVAQSMNTPDFIVHLHCIALLMSVFVRCGKRPAQIVTGSCVGEGCSVR